MLLSTMRWLKSSRSEGRIDMVVNNAGIAIAGAVEDTSIEEARDQFDVNFFGVLRVCRAVLPVLREQRAGYIVNIGSIGGLVAIPLSGLLQRFEIRARRVSANRCGWRSAGSACMWC